MVDVNASLGALARSKGGGTTKFDVQGSRSRLSGGGVGQDAVFYIGVDPQLQIMKKLGEIKVLLLSIVFTILLRSTEHRNSFGVAHISLVPQ